MRNTVGMLAAALALFIALPGNGLAGDYHPKKYGLEFQLGGGSYLMQDINDFRPHAALEFYEPDEILWGTQFGFAILYRQWYDVGQPKNDFGWQFGYNRLLTGVPVLDQFVDALEVDYYISAYLPTAPSDLSWAEQTVVGSEVYAMATWYFPWDSKEVMFGVGPAFYYAWLDRSVDIIENPGSHLTAGSFAEAHGKTLGLIANLGLEIPLRQNVSLALVGGGRLAKVGELKYEDVQEVEHTVYLNPTTNATFPVDFTGGFFKVALHVYFEPTSDWRDPKR